MENKSDFSVISLVALAHGISHFFQIIVAPLFPLIKEELGVSYAALGFSMALFYTLSALFQPVAGFVVDRVGARGVLLGGVGLLAAGTFVAGISESYLLLVLGMATASFIRPTFRSSTHASARRGSATRIARTAWLARSATPRRRSSAAASARYTAGTLH